MCADPENGEWTVYALDPEGGRHEFHADHVISSAAISELAEYLEPRLPEPVLTAARALHYRDFITVALIVKDVDCFDDNWIYIHDSMVKVGRIQNFKSWSPHLVPDPDLNCLGLEYFCFKGDGLWDAKDEDLVRLADEELIQLGLVTPGHVIDGTVIRQPKAYPVYDDELRRTGCAVSQLAGQAHAGIAPGRTQRHAQVQQPGPRDDDRLAYGRKYPCRRAALGCLAREPGRRIPRNG